MIIKTIPVALALAAAPFVTAQQNTSDDLAQQLHELKAKLEAQQTVLDAQQQQLQAQSNEIDALRRQVPSDELTDQRAQQIRALVTDVLADADLRASMLQDGVSAGHDGKSFFIGSTDGNFLLKVGGQIQPRYIANFRDEGAGPAIDENEFGFQLRRVKLFFDGHAFTPDLTYRIQVAANRDSTALELEEATISYACSDALRLIAGQWSTPIYRDQFTSNARQLAVERSIVSYIFTGSDNYSQGIGMDWRPGDMWRIRASVNDGLSSGNPGGTGPGFQNTPNDFHNDSTDFALTGRVDALLAGNWKQMDDFVAWSGEPFGAFIGAGLHYEAAETGDGQSAGTTASTGPYDSYFIWTLDGSIETGGLNVYAAILGMHTSATDANLAPGDMDNYGFILQGGYMIIPDKLEPFLRYELVNIDGAPDDVNVVTIGANYYWRGHALKFTTDLVIVLDPLTGANTLGTSFTGAGLLIDNATADNQVALRAQLQLLF
jgi:phosphate-selective porin OprO/OprP